MNLIEAFYMDLVGKLGCAVCRRLGRGYVPNQNHHVAEASGKRSNFALANLCEEHHDPNRTGSGFHGMGTERFCKVFRVPGESELGLLAWTAEDLARHLHSTHLYRKGPTE